MSKILTGPLAGALLLACALVPARAAEITLKIEHLMSPISPLQAKVLEPWCAKLAAQSDNRIACQIYPAMQLGGTPGQLADLVKNGVVDVVWTVPGYTPGRFPAIEAMELPFVVRDSVSGSRAAWAFYQAHAQKEFAAYKVLSVSMDGGMAFHTSSKPITSPDDIKGMKLRASGRIMAKTISALGADAVAMPTPQVTDAVAKGVVDGLLGAWELVVPFKLDEVTRYHADPPEGAAFPASAVVVMLMNQQKYQSLPADLKAVIDRNSGAPLVEMFGQAWSDATAAGRAKAQESGGQTIRFTPAQQAALQAAAQPVEDEWVREMTAKGLNGAELAKAAHSLGASELPAQ